MTAKVPTALIARVADSCLWFGRYVERAESTARVVQATMHIALDGDLSLRQCWRSAVIVSGEEAAFCARFGDAALSDGDIVQRYLVWENESPVSLRRSVGAARENARSIREALSVDVWETINQLHLWLSQNGGEPEWTDQRDGFYRRVRQGTQLCLGLLRSTMLHDTALDFIWLGMLLERIGQTARLLDVSHHILGEGEAHRVIETAVWLALLRACSGLEPFMRTNAGRVTGARVARFLIGERRFPRSLAYCVGSAVQRLRAIRPPDDHDLSGGLRLDLPPHSAPGSDVTLANPRRGMCHGGAGAYERLRRLDAWIDAPPAGLTLHEGLTHVVDETAAICDLIGVELLGHTPASTVVGAAASGSASQS